MQVLEVCPHCENEVLLPNELGIYNCPVCGKHIINCTICKDKDCENCIFTE